MRRHILGTLALLSLVVALLLTIWPQPDYEVYHAGACRLGLFLTALWLAYPQIIDLPLWIVGSVPLLLLLLTVRPKWFLVALPIFILLLIFRPRKRSGVRGSAR